MTTPLLIEHIEAIVPAYPAIERVLLDAATRLRELNTQGAGRAGEDSIDDPQLPLAEPTR